MEENIYLTSLYDYYSELLTDKQRRYFEDYYFDNLSLAEIGDNYKISRNAVHKQVLSVIEILKNYELKLKLYENSNKIKELLNQIDDKIGEQIKELI